MTILYIQVVELITRLTRVCLLKEELILYDFSNYSLTLRSCLNDVRTRFYLVHLMDIFEILLGKY